MHISDRKLPPVFHQRFHGMGDFLLLCGDIKGVDGKQQEKEDREHGPHNDKNKFFSQFSEHAFSSKR